MSGEEQKNVAFTLLTHVDLDHRANGRLQVVSLRFRRVKDLYRVRASRDGQQWAAVKVHLELASVQRGTHDDDLDRESHGDRGLNLGGGGLFTEKVRGKLQPTDSLV